MMDKFVKLDLETSDFSDLPNDYFDVIIAAHVIEHLADGLNVLRKLSTKIRHGGILYVEFPGEISLRLPHMEGTLNFYDDPTHISQFTAQGLSRDLSGLGFSILEQGRRRDARRLVAGVALAYARLLSARPLNGPELYDFYGFADYVICRWLRDPAKGSSRPSSGVPA